MQLSSQLCTPLLFIIVFSFIRNESPESLIILINSYHPISFIDTIIIVAIRSAAIIASYNFFTVTVINVMVMI